MEIKILTELKNVADTPKFDNKGIPLEEILELETIYNNGSPFPKALRELLFLAGARCRVLDYGLNDTQRELQEDARLQMASYEREIFRPFYVIDIYNHAIQCILIFLDEVTDDPVVYQAYYPEDPDFPEWIYPLQPASLSLYINSGIDDVKNGRNPF